MRTPFKTKIRSWIDTVLQGTHHHYLFQLPAKTGLFAFTLRKLFFSGIHITEEQLSTIRKISEDAIIVYVTKHKNNFDYIFYHTRYQQINLPFPEIGLGYTQVIRQPVLRLFRILLAHIDHLFRNHCLPDPYQSGYIQEQLLKGYSALLSLVEKKGFYRRFVKEETDPIQQLIRLQSETDRPVIFVPQLMFFTRKPQRSIPSTVDVIFGSEGNPGKIRRLIALFRNPGNVFVEISEPVNLKTFLAEHENQNRSLEYLTLVLRRNLLVQLNRHRQTITGPVLKTREELKESILTNDQLRDFIATFSRKRDIPIYKVYKKAEDYLDEIAAHYRPGLIRFYSVIVKWIINHMFDGVTLNLDELNMVKKMYQKGPLIFVPCHKSHVDYIILNYILYHNNLPIPHIAAGKNLSFWPMGPLFRGGGAFFIRRSFRGAVLYSKVFSEYISMLLKDGFNIEFFIEGGRSRTGKLILPKLGLLSILLNAYRNGACNDMIFVPIFLGYDQILEETAYINEIEGGQKKPESLSQVIQARKFLKRRHGRIYIRFHAPISLNEMISANGTSIQDMSPKEANGLCRDLGFRIVDAINKVTVVTPHAIMASAILNCAKHRFVKAYLMTHVDTCMNHLNSQNPILADTLTVEPRSAFDQVFDDYLQRKLIECITKDEDNRSTEAAYTVNVTKRPLLEYYKNNCIAFFIPAAFTALTILEKDAFQFSSSDLHEGYRYLKKLFMHEFAYDVEQSSEYFVRKSIKAFIDDAILMPHPTLPDTYNITSAGLRKLKFFARFLKPYLESYFIVLTYFSQADNHASSKERIKQIQNLGNRMYKEQNIELNEALSKVNYANAVTYFNANNIKSSKDMAAIQLYLEKLTRYLNYMSA